MLNTKEIDSCFKLDSQKSSFLQETDYANVTKLNMMKVISCSRTTGQNRMQIIRPKVSIELQYFESQTAYN
jgi:hypothetical protein